MKRRSFIAGSALALLTGPVLANENKSMNSDFNPLKAGVIVHSVYFWLKDESTKEDERDCQKYFEILAKIPGVQSLNYGRPAPTHKREVVDHSYSFNLILTFKSLDDINVYENHPEHLEASKRFKKYWKKVEVRDTLLV